MREGDYDVLRNTSGGPILCARDQPQQVLSDVRSRLHCSKTCLQNEHCSSFNYKDTVSASGPGYKTYTCEHFNGYPFNFTVDPACRHYAVRAKLYRHSLSSRDVWAHEDQKPFKTNFVGPIVAWNHDVRVKNCFYGYDYDYDAYRRAEVIAIERLQCSTPGHSTFV